MHYINRHVSVIYDPFLIFFTLCVGILIPSSCVNDLKLTLTRIAEQAAGLGAEDSNTPHT